MTRELPLPTEDPFGRGPLVVTRLESPATGVTIEGRFSLGWMGRLTREQLDLVGLLLTRRNNLQQLASDLGLAYNTLRARFDEVVEAVAGAVRAPSAPLPPLPEPQPRQHAHRVEVLTRLARGEIDPDQAASELHSS